MSRITDWFLREHIKVLNADHRARLVELETEVGKHSEEVSHRNARLCAENEDLRTKLALYVGHEPTIREEMAHLTEEADRHEAAATRYRTAWRSARRRARGVDHRAMTAALAENARLRRTLAAHVDLVGELTQTNHRLSELVRA
jgi:dephospho-CoA kinase